MESPPCLWYAEAETNAQLMQGELVYSCPKLVAVENNYDQVNNPKADAEYYDIVIVSQSCSLSGEQCKAQPVLVSSFGAPPAYFCKPEYKKMFTPDYMEGLRKNRSFDFCLLNKCPGHDFFPADYLIVDFRDTFSVPYEIVSRAAKKRPRIQLQSPYREYLSQALARFLTRVGMPNEAKIPDFTKTWSQLQPVWEKETEELKNAQTTK